MKDRLNSEDTRKYAASMLCSLGGGNIALYMREEKYKKKEDSKR